MDIYLSQTCLPLSSLEKKSLRQWMLGGVQYVSEAGKVCPADPSLCSSGCMLSGAPPGPQDG